MVRSGGLTFEHHDLTFETSAGYPWGQLPEGSLVVDVGAGVGSQSLVIAKHHPQLRFIVQDREPVMQDGVEVCTFLFPQPQASQGMMSC